ncbi:MULTISPECIES: methylated-DNA--[protein]-cysteine S-methyltransferase [Methylobacterium]|jgi:methylated-DNA-[protein]-cysteine S-methyltransferase|uniref:methylated-DNA--[protein]-cysteine S-methyltransferase n=1 Tax=Methylobacterium TaxID=407 RepID=UPI0008E6D4A8|nr:MULTISPECIES: methylated-DNA--[protein]-cysteine S-methyltransferase [Methylobacterium]MBZ6413602.1 methylated-DNA--[protein]-cysteine S-methyltransferase [Methylobacterium sp.]MBK3397283.1 methylated-DNA--[protein]-cysteine S-methyltransferase [Methylobacterium ajmalii]MBK3412642.1 methylated-DNA--[protein]-cysteine S-methyltransferase [Methylobacterium ajmalii]MBK3425250.1 methylated-DNA--[protein]-cysteine S-methyltransferase [Methylobacterium ajmalii]SFF36801.1 methylated-DNA-[protein]-
MSVDPFLLGTLPTPIGTMLLVFDEASHLRALDWSDHEARMRRLLRLHYGTAFLLREADPPPGLAAPIAAYFAGNLRAIDGLAVRTNGTAFQREVWAALRTIPVGTTMSYGALAQRLSRDKAVRAVGLANGANPVGLVVPCHRVIGANATLTGYGGGLHRKQWLLAHEGVTLGGRQGRLDLG